MLIERCKIRVAGKLSIPHRLFVDFYLHRIQGQRFEVWAVSIWGLEGYGMEKAFPTQQAALHFWFNQKEAVFTQEIAQAVGFLPISTRFSQRK
jgi:hypothetical protein